MNIQSLDQISRRIDTFALTGYEFVYSYDQTGSDRIATFSIMSNNTETVVLSAESAYQYKVVNSFVNFSDDLSAFVLQPRDFYVGMYGEFYKAYCELMLGNLLRDNGIPFNFVEWYDSLDGRGYQKRAMFYLMDDGLVMQVTSRWIGSKKRLMLSTYPAAESQPNEFGDGQHVDVLMLGEGFRLGSMVALWARDLDQYGVTLDPDTLTVNRLVCHWNDALPRAAKFLRYQAVQKGGSHAPL